MPFKKYTKMKFQLVKVESITDDKPYLLIIEALWTHHTNTIYFAKPHHYSKNLYDPFFWWIKVEQYDSIFIPRKKMLHQSNMKIYKLISTKSMLQQRMLHQILRSITGDETFTCLFFTTLVKNILYMF